MKTVSYLLGRHAWFPFDHSWCSSIINRHRFKRVMIYYICRVKSLIFKLSGGVGLLLLFLFPQVQKGWHDFEHRHDSHCDATAEEHLHQLEHVCDFCDFSIAVGIAATLINYDVFLNAIPFNFKDGISASNPVCFWQSLPPRAPPVFNVVPVFFI